MSLSGRLEAIVGLVPFGVPVADVGSDHAAIPLSLLERGKVPFAMGIENKPGPFAKMRRAVASSPFASSCLLSLSDGLSQADSRIGCAVLAGLGGKLIAAILRRDIPSHPGIETLIVDPHSERPAAYRALMGLGFRETASVSLFEGGLYYEVSRWEKSHSAVVYDERQLTFGPLPLSTKPKPWRAYWIVEAKRLEGIAVSLPQGRNARREELLRRARLIEEAVE